jgi:hypothetical protein
MLEINCLRGQSCAWCIPSTNRLCLSAAITMTPPLLCRPGVLGNGFSCITTIKSKKLFVTACPKNERRQRPSPASEISCKTWRCW